MLTDELTFMFIYCENIVFENSFDKIIYCNFSWWSGLCFLLLCTKNFFFSLLNEFNCILDYYLSDFKSESFRMNLSGYHITVAHDVFVFVFVFVSIVLIVFMKYGAMGKFQAHLSIFFAPVH